MPKTNVQYTKQGTLPLHFRLFSWGSGKDAYVIRETLVCVLTSCLITGYFLITLRNDPGLLEDFTRLLIPAYLIVGLQILCTLIFCAETPAYFKRESARYPELVKIIERILLFLKKLVLAVFILAITFVIAIYFFSRDFSFQDWGYLNGKPVVVSYDDLEYTENVDISAAIVEARKILDPVKPYIIESGEAHDIPPEAIATFILINKMVRERYPTYDPRVGLAHALWEMKIYPQQRNMYDLSPIYNSSGSVRLLMRYLPRQTRIQDRVCDVFGGLMLEASPTVGLMQVRANEIPGFEEEKNVRVNGLWDRFEINTDELTDRQINWMLMRNQRLNIEAGTVALRQALDDTEYSDSADWSEIFALLNHTRDWEPVTHTNDSPLALFKFTQDRGICTLPEADYELFYRIAVESGVFE
ncbi:MAG TPA: hypothetical protein VGB30_04070 [bacterium]|jgi:hypothetical protein